MRFEHSTLSSCRKLRGQRRAFTIIEMIGVMTILALLAAAIIPTLIRRIDYAVWTKETATLTAIADSYTQSILRSKSVPGLATWAASVASQMALPVSAITTNSRGYARAFLIDPNLRINGAVLPFAQTPSGATKPASARVLLVSSIASPLPISSSDNNPDFDAIWNTAEGALPSTWTTWTGKPDDLLIKKLNLEPLFYQLILDGGNQAQFSIDTGATNFVTLANTYYLDGTILGLYDCRTNPQTRYLIQRSISFVFEDCAWRGQIQGAGVRTNTTTSTTSATNFVNRATTFYGTSPNPTAQSGASSISVLVTMYTFMFDYIFWATECPHFDDHGNANPSDLPEYRMLNDIGQNSTAGSLDDISGANGLLK